MADFNLTSSGIRNPAFYKGFLAIEYYILGDKESRFMLVTSQYVLYSHRRP